MTSENRLRTYSKITQRRSRLAQLLSRASADSEASEINVGKRLQELRLLEGLSLRALAEMSGLNVNTLSLIENQKTSPNVSTLNVSITAFFLPTMSKKDVVFLKNGKRMMLNFPQGSFEDLGGGVPLGDGTPLLMTLKGEHESDLDTIIHTGQEFVYCLEGEFAFYVGEKEFILEPGDSLIFEAHIPHRWENRGEDVSRAILVICPSDISDRSVTYHFIDQEND